MVACAWSGSVWGGTTSRAILLRLSSRAILLRLSPRTSTVFGGWSRNPSSRTARPPVASLAGAFAQSLSLYTTRSMGPSRTESTASRSGSSVVRSSLRGHHAPSTYPVWGLGFQPQPRRVFGRCLVSTDVGSMLLWRHGDAPFLAPVRGGLGRVCVCDLRTDAHRGFHRFGDHRPRLRAAILALDLQ
jgi:hypothetical protein